MHVYGEPKQKKFWIKLKALLSLSLILLILFTPTWVLAYYGTDGLIDYAYDFENSYFGLEDWQPGVFPIEEQFFELGEEEIIEDAQTESWWLGEEEIIDNAQVDSVIPNGQIFELDGEQIIPGAQVDIFPLEDDIVPVRQVDIFPLDTPAPPLPPPPPVPGPPPPVCQEIPREYPQCGGTIGLEGFRPTDTIIVLELTNSCTGEKRYFPIRNEGDLGQCLVAPTILPTPGPIIVPPPVVIITPAPQPVPQPIIIQPPAPVVPPPAPIIIQPPAPAPVVQQVPVVPNIQQIQQPSQVVNNQATSSTGPINVSVGAPQAAPIVVPIQQVPVQVPVSSQPVVQVQAPVGAQRAVPVQAPVGSAILEQPTVGQIAVQPAPAAIAAKTPVNVSSELPRTGLPIALWTLSSLIPLGLKFKGFGSTPKGEGSMGRALWQEREFLRG